MTIIKRKRRFCSPTKTGKITKNESELIDGGSNLNNKGDKHREEERKKSGRERGICVMGDTSAREVAGRKIL